MSSTAPADRPPTIPRCRSRISTSARWAGRRSASIISRRYAYHGSTYLAAALSGKASDKTGFQFSEGLVHYVSEANCYSHFMLCVESVRDRASKEPFADDIRIGNRIARHAQSRGLIVRPIGNLNVLSPALTPSREEIDRIVAILRDAIEATMAELDREGFDFAA